jgi:transcriptional regulator with XRE-family HTH domain
MSEYEWLEIFGDNLLNMLDEYNMSQVELSEITGLSQGTISRYINKQQSPGIKAIINISYALDCEIDELIDFGDMIE